MKIDDTDVMINEIDANKTLASKKESYGTKNSFKYFIGYNVDDVIRRLCIKILQMIGYVNHFDNGNNTMSFNANDNMLWKKYNKIWEKTAV